MKLLLPTSAHLLLLSAICLGLGACPISTPNQPSNASEGGEAGSQTVQQGIAAAPSTAGATAAEPDPTAGGAILSNPNATADSPNKVIIGVTPPGVATGTVTTNPNAVVVNANAVVANPNSTVTKTRT